MAASFLDQSVRDLLDLFAAGKTTPGAGSAAALAGALAGGLLQAVARYTIRHAVQTSDAPLQERADALLAEVQSRSERLSHAVDEDASAFRQFWRQGRRNEDLQRATGIPFEIARDCLALAEVGLELADRGFKNARGEAVAATLSALAQGEAAVEIVRLNLKAARDAPWAEVLQRDTQIVSSRLQELRGSVESTLQIRGEGRE